MVNRFKERVWVPRGGGDLEVLPSDKVMELLRYESQHKVMTVPIEPR